jgi:hypothetical protein
MLDDIFFIVFIILFIIVNLLFIGFELHLI